MGYNQDTSGAAANNELNIGGLLYGDLLSGKIAIGTASMGSTLTVQTGDIQTRQQGKGLIVEDASVLGNCYRIYVNNGSVATASVTCP